MLDGEKAALLLKVPKETMYKRVRDNAISRVQPLHTHHLTRQVPQKRVSRFIRDFSRQLGHSLLQIELIATGHDFKEAIERMEALATLSTIKLGAL